MMGAQKELESRNKLAIKFKMKQSQILEKHVTYEGVCVLCFVG